jgi:hypothetical protein
MSNWDEQAVASRANVPANSDMFATELKKINYNLHNLDDLKKARNLYRCSLLCFYVCYVFPFPCHEICWWALKLYYDVVCLSTIFVDVKFRLLYVLLCLRTYI